MSRDRPNKPRTPPLTVQPDERGQALIRRKRGLDLVDARGKMVDVRRPSGQGQGDRPPTTQELQARVDALEAVVEILLGRSR